jgi:PHD/YefM family antitoxin component YafN of YafNO toxin-antitoxin module
VEYVIQAFHNHKRLVAFICDEQGPLVIKRRGERNGIISRHTSPQDRQRILRELNA